MPAELGSTPDRRRWPGITFAIACCTVGLLAGLPLIFLRGIGVYDDSLFLKYGELILKGWRPYVDFIDYKPPVVLYLSAALSAIGGSHWLPPRLFLFLFAGSFAYAVIVISRRLGGVAAGSVASLLFLPSYFIAQGYSFHTEQFGAFLGFVGIYQVLISNSYARYFSAGVLCGLAFLCKQPCLLYVLPVLALPLADSLYERTDWGGNAGRAFAAAIGFAAPLGAFLLFAGPWAPQAFDAIIVRAFRETSFPFTFARLRMWAGSPAILVALASIVAIGRTALRRNFRLRERSTRALLLFGSAGLVSLYPTLKLNATYHYLMCSTPFLACFAALALSPHFGKQPRLRWLLVALCVPYHLAIAGAGTQKWMQGLLKSDLAQTTEIRQVLDQQMARGDRILAISPHSARLYYMSGREPAAPYLVFYWRKEFDEKDAFALLERGSVAAALWDVRVSSKGSDAVDHAFTALSPELKAKYTLRRLETPRHPTGLHETVFLLRNARPD